MEAARGGGGGGGGMQQENQKNTWQYGELDCCLADKPLVNAVFFYTLHGSIILGRDGCSFVDILIGGHDFSLHVEATVLDCREASNVSAGEGEGWAGRMS